MKTRQDYARFAPPTDASPLLDCADCGGELYEGNDVYTDVHLHYCSADCALSGA